MSPGNPLAARLRRQLALAGLLTGTALAAVAATALALAGHGSAVPESVAAALLVVPVSLAAGTSARLRRGSGRVLVGAATVAALSLVTLLALTVVLLLAGELPDRDTRELVLPAAAGSAVAALCFVPLRSAWQRAARLAVHGARREPQDVLRTFGERVSRGADPEELLRQLAESLRLTLAASQVEIWTEAADGIERTLAVPAGGRGVSALGHEDAARLRRADVAGEAWLRTWAPVLLEGRGEAQVRLAPAHHAGEVLGLVLVERAGDATRFTDTEERALGEVARTLGVVLHNRRLDTALQSTLVDLQRTNAELRASRARLVAAADDERRRIERDIHDGAQQHLVALAVNVGLARDILADDPEGAAEILGETSTALRETIQQVRDLAHGIYPPLLKEAGLGPALQAAATRSAQHVTVDVEGVGRHTADVEAAVYFCCLEALQNVAKHAPDADVRLRSWSDANALHFEVADDGPGFDPGTVPAGHGFQNMTDRLGAIGGAVTWRAAPGAGTTVLGSVPTAPAA